MHSKGLSFDIISKCSVSKARAGLLTLSHGTVETPVFMPVGTQGTLKGITPHQLEHLGCRLMLNNTYHLGHRPGQSVLDITGGAHLFEGWSYNLLTDSGGFQMVSLLKLSRITEEGVEFHSPHDGSLMLLTPEYSISLQNSIGSDIIMQLDDVVHSLSSLERVEEAMWRTIRWLDRCIAANKHPERQSLYAIVQGGLNEELRTTCCLEIIKRETPGIAIGGLSGGEEKSQTYKIRFGNALTPHGVLNLRNKCFANDYNPIDKDCKCPCCKSGEWEVTRAYIHHIVCKETVFAHLLTIHNIHYQLNLMREMRNAIIHDQFPTFVKKSFNRLYSGKKENYPKWAIDSLNTVNINLLE
ncbi:hypothetical protein PMAC_002373 [Pneumocystis sp. 'macacae']|nr:hypothetical protein PMAC_002373 [Pneumocystis sp. 'macacae']